MIFLRLFEEAIEDFSTEKVAAEQRACSRPCPRRGATAPSARRCHREAVYGPEALALSPANLRIVDRERKFRPAAEQGFQRADSFDTRELVAQAKMNPGPEGDMPIGLSRKVELLRMLIGPRVEIGGSQHRHDLVAFVQADAIEIHILAHETDLGELYRRDEAQEFLDSQIGTAPIRGEPVAQIRAPQ